MPRPLPSIFIAAEADASPPVASACKMSGMPTQAFDYYIFIFFQLFDIYAELIAFRFAHLYWLTSALGLYATT